MTMRRKASGLKQDARSSTICYETGSVCAIYGVIVLINHHETILHPLCDIVPQCCQTCHVVDIAIAFLPTKDGLPGHLLLPRHFAMSISIVFANMTMIRLLCSITIPCSTYYCLAKFVFKECCIILYILCTML